jgi:hypothetical protein
MGEDYGFHNHLIAFGLEIRGAVFYWPGVSKFPSGYFFMSGIQ